MKDYRRLVIWLDYFNSTLSRVDGRRVPLNLSVKNPSMRELVEAVKRLGYNPEPSEGRYPKRMHIVSGYVSIEKKGSKSDVLKKIAQVLTGVRGEVRESSKSLV